MATLREYFDMDFISTVGVCSDPVMRSECGTVAIHFTMRAQYDFIAHAKYSSFYIPSNKDTVLVCSHLIANQHMPFNTSGSAGGNIQFSSARIFHGAMHIGNYAQILIKAQILSEEYDAKAPPEYFTDGESLPHTKRIYFYLEDELIEVARPLATRLIKMMCLVWYDEYSLQVGDSLCENIERGIKECRKCALILSPNFLSNAGWTKAEFNSMFTREIIETKNLVLPVWHEVTAKQVYEYSPNLADRVALHWSLGEEEVARKLYNAIIS